jgi:Ogr/Delta-like zinc finger
MRASQRVSANARFACIDSPIRFPLPEATDCSGGVTPVTRRCPFCRAGRIRIDKREQHAAAFAQAFFLSSAKTWLKARKTVGDQGGNRKLLCPNCGGAARPYATSKKTDAFKVIYYACANTLCLLRFTATLSIHEMVTPPVTVFGGFDLPKSKWTREARAASAPP